MIQTPWAILICSFQDDPLGSPTNPPVSRALVSRFFSAEDGSFNLVRFFRDMSHGSLDLSGSRVFPEVGSFTIEPLDSGLVSLSDAMKGLISGVGTTADSPPAHDDVAELIDRATQAAIDAGVQLDTFFGTVVLIGAGGAHGSYRSVYADPRYIAGSGAGMEHEMGHGYGLSHSRRDGSDMDYQDPWDTMSLLAAHYADDADYGSRGPGLNAWNMRLQGWLDETRVWKAPVGEFIQSIDLRPLHRRDLVGYLAAELPPIGLNADHPRFLVEFRLKEDWDASIDRSVVLVHRTDGVHSYVMHNQNGDTDFAAGDVFSPFGDGAGLAQVRVENVDEAGMIATVQLSWSPPASHFAPAVAGVGKSVYFFVRTLDSRVFYNRALLGQAGQGWIEVDGEFRVTSAPAAGSVGSHLYLTARGIDGYLYLNQAGEGEAFGQWWPMNFYSEVAPAAAGVLNNICFFATGADGRIFFTRAVVGEAGTGWVEVEGDGRTNAAPAAAAVGKHIFLAIKGLDNTIYINQADLGGPFGQWAPTNFQSELAPAVATVGGSVYFFATAPDGRIFYTRAALRHAGTVWAEVEGDGRTDDSPAAGALGTHVFAAIKGLDGKMYVNQADLNEPFGMWV